MSPRAALPLRLEYAVLGQLRRRPAHGYDLLSQWNAPHGLGLIWRVKPAVLYAALERLEQLGYLKATLIPGESSPTRKEYRITGDGEQAFLAWLKTPVTAAREFRQDFLIRLYFSRDIPAADWQALLARQEQICRGWLASLEGQSPAGGDFETQVVSFRARQVRSILAWLQDAAANQPQSPTGV